MRKNNCRSQMRRTDFHSARLVRHVLFGCFLPVYSLFAQGQAPHLLWETPAQATVFAVDAQTNVYANSNGIVKVLNSMGVLVSSNIICSVTGAAPTSAQRDSQGNYWFFSSFDGTNDFGGTVLVGGWTNCYGGGGQWCPGYFTLYLAKYSSAGALLFVTQFGAQAHANYPFDLALDRSGGAYLAYTWPSSGFSATDYAHFSDTGSNDWLTPYPGYNSPVTATLGGITPSNCCFFDYHSASVAVGRLSRGGVITLVGSTNNGISYNSAYTYGRAALDDSAAIFQAGSCRGECVGQVILRKLGFTNVLWEVPIGAEEQVTLARDLVGNVYLGGVNGTFSAYSTDGILIWSTNYGQTVTRMLVDNSGNRFLGFANGDVGRLSDETPAAAPSIANGPVSRTVFIGDPVTFTVSATGTGPLYYYWFFNATNTLSSTSNSFSIASAALANAGTYSVIVSNQAGSVTSAPAILRVKQVEWYFGSQLLTNGNYVFPTPPTVSVHSAFSGGSIYYTLDGSTPDFSSTPYTGPSTVTNSAVARAIGYSADFSQSEQADTVNITVLPYHTLTASSTGGGSVTLNPPGRTYASTNIVTATAVPNPGWSFLGWQGDASGSTLSVNVSMERDKSILATFGTTLSTTVVGNGQVQLYPSAQPYVYGTVVRLTGVPQPGSYFGSWGNAASGNTNPLYFSITAPTQTISSIFGTLSTNQAALTILINGNGTVSANPRANVFTTNQSVVLTATPGSGQMFVNWSGDASGTQNPLTLAMTQSRIVTANFGAPGLYINPASGDGLSSNGFRFTLISTQAAWQIYGSSNLNNWNLLATVTNTQGSLQFTDPAATSLRWRFYKATLQ